MSQLDTFGVDYLRLTLEIDKHIDGYIDAYYGPAALRDEVRAAPLRSPADLLDDVDRLEANIPEDDPARAVYLAATLRAIECTVRMVACQPFEVISAGQSFPQLLPERVIAFYFRHGGQPQAYLFHVEQRIGHLTAQKPGAHRRDRFIDQ